MLLSNKKLNALNVDELVRVRIENSELEKILIVVPTNRKLRHLKKDIINHSPGKTADVINLETLGTLTEKILGVSRHFVKLSEAASTVLIKQSANEIPLQYLNVYKNEIPHGTLDRIKNVISEYKKHGINPNLLREEAKKLDDLESRKAVDIANIYETYKEKCYNLSALETGDIYEEIVKGGKDKFSRAFRKLFPHVEQIIVTGFDEFFQLEIEILDYLKINDTVDLIIAFDYYEKNPQLFSHLDEAYLKLKKKEFYQIKDLTPDSSDKFLQDTRRYLFANKKQRVNNSYKEKISVVESLNKINEVKFVAKEIKRKLTEEKAEPHNICVAFNLIQNYTPVVRDIFKLYGIPVNITDRYSLDKALPVTALITVLEILENDFFYKDIFRAFGNVYVNSDQVDLDVLIKVAAKLKIVGGKTNWISKIKNAISFNQTGEEIFEEDNDEREQLEKALQSINFIDGLLKPFREELTIPEFQNKLKVLAFDLGIFEKILTGGKEDAEINIKAVRTLFETTDEIFDLLTKEFGKEKRFNLKFYLDQLRTASGWARFNIKERSDYGVLVTTINEIRGLKFDYLFICGMNDGEFPTRYNPEIFHSGSFAKDSARHLLEEKFHFYQALNFWRKGLYLTYAKYEEENELVQSSFINDFKKVFEVTERKDTEYDNYVLSKEELDKTLGIYWGSGKLNLLEEKFKIDFNKTKLNITLEVDKLRNEEPFAPTPYTGFLFSTANGAGKLSEDAGKKLKKFVEREFSVSQLEVYANCPYKFFLERVLKIEEVKEPTEEIEAVELGNLMHEIFYDYYTFIRENKIDTSSESLSGLHKILTGIAEKKYERFDFDSPLSFYEKEKIFGVNGKKEDSILYRFLLEEQNKRNGFVPSFFEVGFGSVNRKNTDKILSTNKAVTIDEIKLRGKIDRIDLNPGKLTFRILDYKLSEKGKPAKKDLLGGYSLQLPVYLIAAGNILSEHFGKEFSPAGMIIFSLKYQADYFGYMPAVKIRNADESKLIDEHLKLKDIAKEKIKEYIKNISEGKFNLTLREDPEKNACKYCNFKTICRIQEALN